MKKLLLLICLFLLVLCTGCQKEEDKTLGTLNETITSVVDPTASINVDDFITVEDGTEVSYVIDPEDEKIIFTLTKDNRTETIEVEVTFVEEEKPVEDIDGKEPAVTEDVSAEEVPEETAAETETAEPEVQTWVYDCEFQAPSHPDQNFTGVVYTLNSDGTGHLTTPYWDGDISWSGDIVDNQPLISGHVGEEEFVLKQGTFKDGTISQHACKLRK